jgi:predicted DNA-binding antitoxin AbrB/MazE fold protein
MTNRSISVEAIFDNGVLRPLQTLPLQAQQRIAITLQWPGNDASWPEDVATIYQEIAEEERRLAETMLPAVQETWPVSQGQP